MDESVSGDSRGMDTAWPLRDVLIKLADNVEHLRDVHNCDCHGYEEYLAARDAALQYAARPVVNEDDTKAAREIITAGDHGPQFDELVARIASDRTSVRDAARLAGEQAAWVRVDEIVDLAQKVAHQLGVEAERQRIRGIVQKRFDGSDSEPDGHSAPRRKVLREILKAI